MTTTTRNPVLLGIHASFGFGDRIGLATAGHIEALRHDGAGIAAIYPQQSIREMARTGRSPAQVMQEAVDAVVAAGRGEPFGSDADHLKTREDVDVTAAAGFTMFTIDPSAHVDERADSYDAGALEARYAAVRDGMPWIEAYRGQGVDLPSGARIAFDDATVMRAAVKYGAAVNHAVAMAGYIREVQDAAHREHEIELSVDETAQPTSLAEHYMIAHRCLEAGMRLVSLAPRFVGDFEKGVDYIGDADALERSLADHAAVAAMLGPYKLSLHSGSDKLSMYTAFARATEGRFHVKTAGTSYLEALRVMARHDPALFRQVCAFARERYDTDKATYHVHATLADTPPPEDLADADALEAAYLECWDTVPEGRGFTAPGRQLLHCTFGSVLTHDTFGPALRACLERHRDTYRDVLVEHFGRHLRALRAGMA